MSADLTPTTELDFIATLSLAAAALRETRSDRPPAPEVVNALLQAEKAAKQQRLTYPKESLLGNWQLYFTAPRKPHLQGGVAIGKGFYIPQIAPAQISTTRVQTSSQVEIGNSIQFGQLLFKLTGPARYLGKKNLLAFDFNHVQLSLFGRTVYGGEFRGGKAAAEDFYS